MSPLWWFLPLILLIGFLKSPWFKGATGEALVRLHARLRLPSDTYRSVHNVTLQLPDGTTQIDHVIVSRFGVFVVETKHMKGWIFRWSLVPVHVFGGFGDQDVGPKGESRMKKRIVSISPWQSAKNMAVLYFAFGVLFVIPMGVLTHFAPEVPGQTKPGIGFFILMPILYGLAGLIFVPIGCWMYNKVASFMGGIEFEVEDEPRQEAKPI